MQSLNMATRMTESLLIKSGSEEKEKMFRPFFWSTIVALVIVYTDAALNIMGFPSFFNDK